jgi:DNA-binding IclR family transcriptional regulator
MKEIRNTTQGPLRVPLPRGKTLHLPPRQTGRVAPAALEHPPLKKLLEAGQLEVLGDAEQEGRRALKSERGPVDSRGHGHSNVVHPSGDR